VHVHVHSVIQINVRIISICKDFSYFFFEYIETCLCTTAKRDSLYDDQYGFTKTGKFKIEY
jgi:hypothetical protein